MSKKAFITMDMESFFDSGCMRRHNIASDEEFDCANEVKRFIEFLDKQKIKSTIFVTVSFLPRCKDILLEAIKHGHEIALHCLEHKEVKKISVEEFDKEIKEAKEIIKRELGVEPVGFRFPCFKYKDKYMQVIKGNGFLYDSSATARNLRSKISIDKGFYEFAPNVHNLMFFRINLSGGGYLRLMPELFYKRKLKRALKNDYFMLYLHPFEIYEGQFPKYKELNIFEKMYISRGRDKYLSTISSLIDRLKLEEYEFFTMKDYIAKENANE